jgi:hypothetical protein
MKYRVVQIFYGVKNCANSVKYIVINIPAIVCGGGGVVRLLIVAQETNLVWLALRDDTSGYKNIGFNTDYTK